MENNSDRKITILFGSQTGTAEDAARRIGRDALRLHFNVVVCSLDEYNIANLANENAVVFVVATTGQGDPPTNMKKFWKFIWRKNLQSDCLDNLKFAVLGFGDSSYQKFNFIAKKLRKRLIQLGAAEIASVGLADDQHDLGCEATVDPWIKELKKNILRLFPLSQDVDSIPDDDLLPPTYRVSFDTVSTTSEPFRNLGHKPDENSPFLANVTGNTRVTSADHWQDVRLITLDISGSEIKYSPGDVCYVEPQNLPDTVEEFIDLLRLNPSERVFVRSEGTDEVPPKLRNPRSVRYLIESYLDINSIPRRYFWELMAQFTDSDLERDKLKEFCSPEGQEDLFNYCNRPKRTILEVMRDFPGATSNIRFEYLFDMIPRLRPRAFSIASSQIAHPNEIQLLIAVVRYKTRLVTIRRGVCSNHLASLVPSTDESSKLSIWVERGTICFPDAPTVPVIMVGPGTGCAPFRSFIQERSTAALGGNVLFFGCRNRLKDFYFDDEWRRLESNGFLKLFVAFSRDQVDKVYVQHLLAEQSTLVWDLLDKDGAFFFVAGNSKNMPDSVREALKQIAVAEGGRTDEEAEDYVQELEKKKRFQLETWS